tara:strand:- start:54999 stop:55679 length:681 start_codon:yes stop_codon:yes gene_type:complete
MRSVLAEQAPNETVIDLLSDAPTFNAEASSYLLAALVPAFSDDAIIVGVVDPGVGSDRRPIIMKADKQIFVGPDNGLFSVVAKRASEVTAQTIDWKPKKLSASFHGRDLFAPVAAMLAAGSQVDGRTLAAGELVGNDWPTELNKVIYVDHFGNAITGIRAQTLTNAMKLEVREKEFSYARTFSCVESGAAFWYENANGLAEISVNQGRADDLGITIGDHISILAPE